MIQALPRAAAIRAVMENSWFGYPNSVLRGACFISITDNDTVADPDDLAYAQWSGSDWVHSSRVRDFSLTLDSVQSYLTGSMMLRNLMLVAL